MKNIRKKLLSKRGETLVEILIAILIIALSAAMFAGMYSAAMRINTSAREGDKAFNDAVKELEEMMGGSEGEGTDGQLTYTPVGDTADKGGAPTNFDVEIFTSDGMTVYRGKKA